MQSAFAGRVYSGQSGFSGFSGIVGTSGFSGLSGFSGFSGFSGRPGTAGAVSLRYLYSTDLTPPAVDPYISLDAVDAFDASTLFVRHISTDFNASTILLQYGAGDYVQIVNADGTKINIFLITGFLGVSEHNEYSVIFLGGVGASYSQNEIVDVMFSKTGASGFSGQSGFSGFSGVGASGFSGAGASGFSGLSGFSGRSGFSGATGTGINEFQISVVNENSTIAAPTPLQLGKLNVLAFDPITNNAVDFIFELPEDIVITSDLIVSVAYHASDNTAGDVRLLLEYEVVAVGQDSTPAGNTGSVTNTVTIPSSSADVKQATTFTIPSADLSSITASIRFTLQRQASNGADTYAGDFRVETIAVRYNGFGAPTTNSGYSGVSGFSGFSGYSGLSAPSGISGFSGESAGGEVPPALKVIMYTTFG